VRAVRRKLALIGVGLIAVGIFLVATSIGKCFSELPLLAPGVQCPAPYIGLGVFAFLTLGLTALAIAISR